MPDLARTTYDEISDAAGLLEIGVGQLIRVMVVWADATGAARKTMMSMGRHYNQKEILLPSFHFRLRDLKHTMPLILRLPKTPGNAPQRMADECEQARGLPGWLKVHIIWQAWKLEFPLLGPQRMEAQGQATDPDRDQCTES